MVVVEQQLGATTMTVEQMDGQVRNLLALMTPTAEAAKAAQAAATQNAITIKELSVTSERLLKSQENVSNKVSSLETQVEGLGTRITSLEGAITAAATANQNSGLDGHREETANQGTAFAHVLGNGECRIPRNQHESGPSRERAGFSNEFTLGRHDRQSRENLREFRMPKTNFPKFDGSNPKIWEEKAEKYFHMFHVPDEYKVDYATLHFIGTAALWLQTYET